MPDAEIEQGENQAIIDFAVETLAELAQPVEVETLQFRRLPPGWTEHKTDLEPFKPRPVRSSGEIVLHDVESFLSALAHRRLDDYTPVVYADETTTSVVAVLNDDVGDASGWRDYRLRLGFARTPEWTAWQARAGQDMTQEPFADHVASLLRYVVEPEGAELLEILWRFEATVSARWESSIDLGSGHRLLTYEETVRGTKKGDSLTLPSSLRLRLRPFVGGPAGDIEARLKVRAREGVLHLSYLLDQPQAFERDAVEAMVTQLQAQIPEPSLVLFGKAPAAQ